MNSNFFRKTAVILSVVMLLTGCGAKTAPSAETQVSEVQEKAQETKTVNEIYQEITEQVSLESPACMKDDFTLIELLAVIVILSVIIMG